MNMEMEYARKLSSMKKEEMHLRAEMLALSDTAEIVGRLYPHTAMAKQAYDDFRIARGEYESARDNLQALLQKCREDGLI